VGTVLSILIVAAVVVLAVLLFGAKKERQEFLEHGR
jgi:Sec-independent protein translocase protein TatA